MYPLILFDVPFFEEYLLGINSGMGDDRIVFGLVEGVDMTGANKERGRDRVTANIETVKRALKGSRVDWADSFVI